VIAGSEVQNVSHQNLVTAIHEAGHAVATVLLGQTVDAISTLPQGQWGGTCYWSRHEPIPETFSQLHGTILEIDWRYRRLLETRLAITLAGPAAVARWAPATTDYLPPPLLDQTVEQLIAEFERASATIEEREAAAPLERQTDLETAFRLAPLGSTNMLIGPAFLHWMVAEVNVWVASRAFARPLRALTDELLQRRVLTGDRVHEVVNKEIPEWARARTDVGEETRELAVVGATCAR
jgi:hypothetical protein